MRDDLLVVTFYGGPRDGERMAAAPEQLRLSVGAGYRLGLSPAGELALVWKEAQ